MNAVRIKYAELLRLSVEQLFYRNGICRQYKTEPAPDMDLVPTESCLNVLKRMASIFKPMPTASGFTVLARVSVTSTPGTEVLCFPPRKEDVLSFLLVLKNPDVVNFNELPAQPAKEAVYYFSNEVADPAAPRSRLHLTKNASGVNGTADVIKKSSENYRFHHATVIVPGTALVRHTLSGQTVPPVALATAGGQSDVAFNLSALPTGKCRLLISNLPVDEFYYLGEHYAEPVFGVVELSLSPALIGNYRVVEPDRSLTPDRPQYRIRFLNRQTTWRYTVRLSPTSPLFLEMAALPPLERTNFLNRLNIEANDASITFTKTVVADAEFVFVSGGPIFLQEKYFSSTSTGHDLLILTLKKYIGDAAKEAAVKTGLPYPSTAGIDASSPPQIFSDVFLTI